MKIKEFVKENIGYDLEIKLKGGLKVNLSYLLEKFVGQINDKCEHTKDERTGETKLWCCNICGKRIENF